MKWDFFYNEGDDNYYQSINDWYKDIRHLVFPFIAMVILGLTVLTCTGYFLT